MNQQPVRVFTIFIASPSDLGEERLALREVVERIARNCSRRTNLRIELLGWEDTLPRVGRPQDLINEDLDKADLFIGCLWKKMGSPSGMSGRTGFEEEFYRALEKHKKAGVPEMSLFFKRADESDPGEHLKKVLAFKTTIVEAKTLLFSEFDRIAQWRDMVEDLLLNHVFKLLHAKPASSQEAQSVGGEQRQVKRGAEADESSISPESQKALESLSDVLDTASKEVAQTDALDPVATARLLLFAATTYDSNTNHIEFGSHETNSVYSFRETLVITGQERLFLVRTLLLDTSMTKPGWYWMRSRKPDLWLSYLAIYDSDESLREAVVALATKTHISLRKALNKGGKAIVSILADRSEIVRLSGLNYLAAHGGLRDLKIVAPLLADDSTQVRSQAERTARLIRLRANPDIETVKSIHQSDTFDDAILESLSKLMAAISDGTLRAALVHPTANLRALAGNELLRRAAITKDLGHQLCHDDAKAVRQCGLIALVRHGVPIESAEVRKKLAGGLSLLDSGGADAEAVIAAAFERLDIDELWRRVRSFDEDSPIALAALGRRYFKDTSETIREELHDEFKNAATAAKNSQPPVTAMEGLWRKGLVRLGIIDPIENVREKLVTTAIEILAGQPDNRDRPVYLKYLSSDATHLWRTVGCLRALGRVGAVDDRETVRKHLFSESAAVVASAALAYLSLSPNSIIGTKDIVREPSEQKVWVVTASALNRKDKQVWSVLEPLLTNETDDIRRIVSYYAVEMLTRRELKALLTKYQTGGRYFYNVVVLLDRAIYAPGAIRYRLRDEEHDYLKKWEGGGLEMPIAKRDETKMGRRVRSRA